MFADIVTFVQDVKPTTVMVNNKPRTVLNSRVAIYNGKNIEDTYIDVTAWDKTAEMIAKHFKKGNQIYIEGNLQGKEKRLTAPDKSLIPYPSFYIHINSFKLIFETNKQEENNEKE